MKSNTIEKDLPWWHNWSMPNEIKVDIGCGERKKSGFIGIDYISLPGVDYVLDITKDTLPFEDNSVSYVYSHHCLEHIKNPQLILKEITRVCKDCATVEIWLPLARSNDGFVLGHETFYQELTWIQICDVAAKLWQKDWTGRLVLKHFKYILSPGIERELKQVNIPIYFALQHLSNIAEEFCAYMKVIKNQKELEAIKRPELDVYVAYDLEENFRKVSPVIMSRIQLNTRRIGTLLPNRFRKLLQPIYRLIFER